MVRKIGRVEETSRAAFGTQLWEAGVKCSVSCNMVLDGLFPVKAVLTVDALEHFGLDMIDLDVRSKPTNIGVLS